MPVRVPVLVLSLAAVLPALAKEPSSKVEIDKKNRSVTLECVVAPRKLPTLDKIYPIEVVATFAAPKGQKAHETVVNFTAKPSEVHRALESLGLKPGTPVMGKGVTPRGTDVDLFLEVGEEGKSKKIRLEEALVDSVSGKGLSRLRWVFTGSVMSMPDPEKDDKVYGADFTGTLITLFPVTNESVIQAVLPFEGQGNLKIETNSKVLPRVGTPIKLIIQAR